jgi:hypothetical protein
MRLLSLTALLLLPSVALAGAKANAFKKDPARGNNFWAANAAVDGKVDTAWQVPGDVDNVGSWIELSIPAGTVDKIAIFPGWGKDPESWGQYPRPKKLRVDVNVSDENGGAKTVGTASVLVNDKMELQLLEVPDIPTGEGLQRTVRLTVEEMHGDTDYPSLVISEAAILMKEFDARATFSAASAEVTGKGKELAGDENPKTVFATQAGATLTFGMHAFSVSSVGFLATDKTLARPKTLELTTGPLTRTVTLADKPGEAQWAPLPLFNGLNGGYYGDFTVKIVDTYPGVKSQEVGLAEVKFRATSSE